MKRGYFQEWRVRTSLRINDYGDESQQVQDVGGVIGVMDVDYSERDYQSSHKIARNHVDNNKQGIFLVNEHPNYHYYKHENGLIYQLMHVLILPYVIVGGVLFCVYLALFCYIGSYCDKSIKFKAFKKSNQKLV